MFVCKIKIILLIKSKYFYKFLQFFFYVYRTRIEPLTPDYLNLKY